MVFMWANFKIEFKSKPSGLIALIIIPLFLALSVAIRTYFYFSDKSSRRRANASTKDVPDEDDASGLEVPVEGIVVH